MRSVMQSWMIKNLNVPYRWGGDDSVLGYDCSGLAQEFLKSFGFHPNQKVDFTAQALHNHFKGPLSKANVYDTGGLLFFGSNEKAITHIALCFNDKLMFEAGGGGSKTLTIADATNQNAFTRIRPISNRKDLLACLMPVELMKVL